MLLKKFELGKMVCSTAVSSNFFTISKDKISVHEGSAHFYILFLRIIQTA